MPDGIVNLYSEITFTITTPGAEIWYTTDGTTPIKESGTSQLFTIDPIVITKQFTNIKVIGVLPGYLDSPLFDLHYEVIKLEKALTDPLPGPIVEATQIILQPANSEPFVELWYTLDGSVPERNGSNSLLYTNPITLYFSTSIKVIAWKIGKLQSDVLDVAFATPAINRFVICARDTNSALISQNGINWILSRLPEVNNWQCITYGDNKFVILTNTGKGAYSETADNLSWTTIPIPVGNWVSMLYKNGMFIAIENGTARAIYSNDGISWFEGISLGESQAWTKIIYGNGVYIAIASNSFRISRSINGMSWEVHPLGGHPITNFTTGAFGNNVFLIGSNSGGSSSRRITRSIDNGQTWSNSDIIPNSLYINDIIYGDNEFIAVLNNNEITLKSVDGLTWTIPGTPNLPFKTNWSKLSYKNKRYITIPQTSTNGLAYSNNGIDWFNATLPNGFTLLDITARG